MLLSSSTSKLLYLFSILDLYSDSGLLVSAHSSNVNGFFFLNRSTPHIPEVQIPKEPVLEFAMALRFEINRAFSVLRDIAVGRDLKMFLSVCCFWFLLYLVLGLFAWPSFAVIHS